MGSDTAAGVDWAGGKWLAIVFERGSYVDCRLFDHINGIFEWEERSFDTVLADVPIGLPDGKGTLAQREHVDSLARSTIREPSSVFPVPSRNAARLAHEGKSYEVVADQNREDVEKGLTWPSYHIAAGIGEVDELLGENKHARKVLVESHPEVCFSGLFGDELQHSKNTAQGVGERLETLATVLDNPGEVLESVTGDLVGRPGEVAIDDVIDVLVLGATAAQRGDPRFRYLSGTEGDTEWNTDSKGLPMRMAYWAEEPLP